MPGVESQVHRHKKRDNTEAVLGGVVGKASTLKIIDATAAVPNNMILLRDDVFVSELGILSPDELLTSNDRFGIHVLLFENESGRLVGATHVAPAEQILFMHYAGFDAHELSTSVLSRNSVIAKDFRSTGILSLLLSAAANFYVRSGRSKVITYLQDSYQMQQNPIHLTPVANVTARTEHFQSGQSITLKPYFILFQDLLNLDRQSSKLVEDLVYEMKGFDWIEQDTVSDPSFNMQSQNTGLDGK